MTSMEPVVMIAGVPWPRYKLVALLAGLVVCGVVGLATLQAAPAVLAGATAATVVWLAHGLRRPRPPRPCSSGRPSLARSA
ncbi:hypothetical protein [uncultured Mycolicibacterium sp.]|mgnify:CR=1 FL=1|uniref:hypothetical protein n=1 Tax=uncultured Mycolicibacterium sp. TaxID=2320817 RepID=UPI00262A301A|nr:hypothetical protein [uncultured Mycolicibacterium sp.]